MKLKTFLFLFCLHFGVAPALWATPGGSGNPPAAKTQSGQYSVRLLDPLYHLEASDSQHRHGLTLSEKKKTFDQLNGAGSFWDWLDQEAGGKEIPKVIYLKPEERASYRIRFEGNRLVHPTLEKSDQSGILEVMFVMDTEGEFYVAPKVRGNAITPAFHHSSFFAGNPVSGAGLFFLDRQSFHLVKVSDYSGHYRNSDREDYQVLDALHRRGVDLGSLEFEAFLIKELKTQYQVESQRNPTCLEWYRIFEQAFRPNS